MLKEKHRKTARPTRKAQILELYEQGVHDVETLAELTGARPSYVAQVLREAGRLEGYFDLYTSTAFPMNVYSRWFAGRLGYRDVETAQRSVALIDERYRHFAEEGDRTGQHHAMLMALTMFNRARWRGKHEEAEVFRSWLMERLRELDAPE